jgi:MoaA/NifB/PqqE/SkfB family radical SAM enzyme
MPNPYADTKVLWHLDKLHDLRNGKQIAPEHFQLILSDTCSQDCAFCSYRLSGYTTQELWGGVRNPKRIIPYDKAVEILNDFALMGVKAVQFTGGGEPTVHPQHKQLFDLALSLGLQCALVSNGILISKQPDWLDTYSRFSWVRISLDAGTMGTYSRIRRCPPWHFDKAIDNLAALAKTKGPMVGVSYVVLKENVDELYDAALLSKAAGAAYIRFGAFFSQDDDSYYRGWDHRVREAIAQVRESCEFNGFKVVDMFGQRLEDLHQHQPDYDFCGFQFLTGYIGADLNVYRCCNTAYSSKGVIGSIKDQRLSKMWLSHETVQAMRGFDAKSCERCCYNGKNRLIYGVMQEPTHASFI